MTLGMISLDRVLVRRARKLAQQYFLVYQEPIPTGQLVQRVASVMQEYTQSGCVHFFLSFIIPYLNQSSCGNFSVMFSRGVRPFGVSLLIAGWDEDRPYLFQSDPSVRQININHNLFITVYSLYSTCNCLCCKLVSQWWYPTGSILCLESHSNGKELCQWKNISWKKVSTRWLMQVDLL